MNKLLAKITLGNNSNVGNGGSGKVDAYKSTLTQAEYTDDHALNYYQIAKKKKKLTSNILEQTSKNLRELKFMKTTLRNQISTMEH